MTGTSTATGPRLAPGQRRNVQVSALAAADGALASVDGDRRPVRVAGGVPGDVAEVWVSRVGQHAAWARIERIVIPSPQRVAAPCPIHLTCGGCPWMGASPQAQRDARLQGVRSALSAALDQQTARGGPLPQWQLWPGSQTSTGFRTRALVMMAGRGEGLHWGLYAPGTERVVPTQQCAAHDPRLDATLHAVTAVLGRHGLGSWDRRAAYGDVSALQVRLDPSSGTVSVLVAAREAAPIRQAADDIMAISGVTSLWVNLPAAGLQTAIGPVSLQLGGAERQPLTWQGPNGPLTLEVGPGAFVQTRHDLAETLLQEIAASLPAEMGHLLDLYGGIGVMGLALRQRARKLTLAERDEVAVRDALFNVSRLQQSGELAGACSVVPGDALSTLLGLAASDVDAAILDPPRAGCGEAVIAALGSMPHLRSLALASCGLPGLARDTAALVASGWTISRIAVLEMFPHAPHAEVVVSLQRPVAAAPDQPKAVRKPRATAARKPAAVPPAAAPDKPKAKRTRAAAKAPQDP